MTTLLSFHNDPAIKKKYLNRVRMHREADALVQGIGWENGKGCAIGCTLENYDHSLYPSELGLPEWLAHLEDRIFEGLSKADAMAWPERFLSATPVGANVEPVRHQLAIRRMDRLIALQSSAYESATEQHGVKAAIAQTIEALQIVRGYHEAQLGRAAADSVDQQAAYSAADSAALSADSAHSARSAAYSAAHSARSAAYSAADSACSAACSAAHSAAYSAYSAAWAQEAADLIELLEALAP